MFAKVWFTAGSPQLGEVGVDFAERREDFVVGSPEGISIDCAHCNERSGYVPVA
jgi:hypothetical protein